MDSIAVIGLACRFPGEATTAEKFWELLCKAKCEKQDFGLKAMLISCAA